MIFRYGCVWIGGKVQGARGEVQGSGCNGRKDLPACERSELLAGAGFGLKFKLIPPGRAKESSIPLPLMEHEIVMALCGSPI